jgi:iron complex transport system substrate-binding protein
VVDLRGTLLSLNHVQEAAVRIVSLPPSATEIVDAVGLGDRLVGVSHECDFPAAVRGLPRVTRSLLPDATATSGAIDAAVRDRVRQRQPLYALDAARLADLRPDLIVTQSICDVCAVAEGEVAAVVRDLPGPPRLLTLEPHRLGDVLDGMQAVADAAGVADAGRAAVAGLQHRIDAVAASSAAIAVRPRVMLLEWLDPPFTAGHWSPEIVGLAGGVEVLGRAGERSRAVTWEEIRAADPEVLVVACCGFDVERTRRELPSLDERPGYRELACVRTGRVHVVDGNAFFSRPGPRLVDALEGLAHLLHPAAHPPAPTAGFA